MTGEDLQLSLEAISVLGKKTDNSMTDRPVPELTMQQIMILNFSILNTYNKLITMKN